MQKHAAYPGPDSHVEMKKSLVNCLLVPGLNTARFEDLKGYLHYRTIICHKVALDV